MENQCTLAIFIRQFERQTQFYTMWGSWTHRIAHKSYFVVQSFVPPAELEPIIPFLPEQEVGEALLDQITGVGNMVPRDVGAPLVVKMDAFVREANEVYRKHATKIDRAWDVMAQYKEFSWVHLKEITTRVLGISDEHDIPHTTLWAVHRAILTQEIGFLPERLNHWQSGMWEVLSRDDRELINQMRLWLRDYQEGSILAARSQSEIGHDRDLYGRLRPEKNRNNVITNFVKWARPIVTESRKYRQLIPGGMGGIGPCSTQLPPRRESWSSKMTATRNVSVASASPSDTLILRFMEFWAARQTIPIGSPLFGLGPMVLRATGLYEGLDLNQAIGFTFLQEMGVLTPWENRAALSPRLALPGLHFDTKTDNLLVEAFDSSRSWQPKDKMQHLRKDWGNMEVFCIDAAEAYEIDDGISLEPVKGDESSYWIHAHIANPTAFIPPDHPMAKYAAQLTETLYFPEKNYNMLAPSISQKYFSLGDGKPTLTISVRVTNDGHILDTDIAPGKIHKVTYLTPETLFETIAPKDANLAVKNRYIVGNPIPDDLKSRKSKMATKLSPIQIKTLQKLFELGLARTQRRESQGAAYLPFGRQECRVHYTEITQPWRRQIRRIEGDPTIVYDAGSFDPSPSPAARKLGRMNEMVPYIMLIAGEAIGMWCSKRQLPITYRITVGDPNKPSPKTFKRNFIDPFEERAEVTPWLNMLNYVRALGRTTTSLDPRPQLTIGAESYVKATSPLRRYGDMLVHWQIEAALLREAAARDGSTNPHRDYPYPFPKAKLESLLPRLTAREKLITQAKVRSHMHWIVQLLIRTHYFGEGRPLPEEFRVFIGTSPTSSDVVVRGITKELGLPCYVRRTSVSDSGGGILLGDTWRCKIHSIEAYSSMVRMEPICLEERIR